MSSIIRRIAKAIAMKKLTADERAELKKSRTQLFRSHEDGIGYDVLHPTRGWKRVSARRVLAGVR